MNKPHHKKVTYTLKPSVIEMIERRSLLTNISKSKLVSHYIVSGFDMMVDEYYENNKQPLNVVKKMNDNIPMTFTISTDILDVIDFFSDKLDVKKSHLVMSCVVNFERELKKREEEKLNQQIYELMELVEESSHNK